VPLQFKVGFHHALNEGAGEELRSDPELLLVHFHRIDYELTRERHRAFAKQKWNEQEKRLLLSDHQLITGDEEEVHAGVEDTGDGEVHAGVEEAETGLAGDATPAAKVVGGKAAFDEWYYNGGGATRGNSFSGGFRPIDPAIRATL
jgi:hypothetical protein